MRIHLARKHALEFELLDYRLQTGDVRLDFRRRRQVAFRRGQLEQLRRVGETPGQSIQIANDRFELRAFFAEILRPIRIVPDARLLEFAFYFLESLVLGVVIKDTPSRSGCVPRDL
ncbi:MAG: hypothetical protein NVSMB10_00330 [Steroidobacteraceae bacterium]